MTNRKFYVSFFAAFIAGTILTFAFPPPKDANAQVFGPTTRTPQLTVSPGNTSVQNLTINGTCTGCPSTPIGGADTQVQYNDGGSALGGDAGLTYNETTDTLSATNLSVSGTITNEQIEFESGTVSVAWTDCNGSPTNNTRFWRFGKFVILEIQTVSCTAIAGNFQFKGNFFTQRPDLEPDGIYFSPLIGATNNGVAGFAKFDIDDGGFFGWQFCAHATPQTCGINSWTSTAGQIRTAGRIAMMYSIP